MNVKRVCLCFPKINSVSDNSATRGGTDNYSESDFPSASPPYVTFPIDFNVLLSTLASMQLLFRKVEIVLHVQFHTVP